MYPDLEVIRRASETYDKMPSMQKGSNLEKNCGQVFNKRPNTLTRDILGKMQYPELVPSRTFLMGREFKTKQLWILAGLCLLFLCGLIGTGLMWGTNSFDNFVHSKLALAEGTEAFEKWQKPSARPKMRVYIFNYTNVDRFESGEDEKLVVKELGPYVYNEIIERVNVEFNGSLLSYQEKRNYKYLPEISKGKQNDRLTLPNVPMMAAAAVNKHSTFFTRLALSQFFSGIYAKTFINIPAHRFIMGYEDQLYSLSKSVLKFQDKNPYENFGLLASRVGFQKDVITINSGADDISKLGDIVKLNGADNLGRWSTDECNSLHSTDGSMFPPLAVSKKQPLRIFQKAFCRVLPLEFQKETTVLNGKVPAYRYVVPPSVFDTPDEVPENQCYCDLDSGFCPAKGLMNITGCSLGAPLFISMPHFHGADPSLPDTVEGLRPNDTEYESFVDMHPFMGYPMRGVSRFQLNVQVMKSYGISQFDKFDDEMILPVAWFEYTLDDEDLPEDVLDVISRSTYTVRTVESVLKYGCILMMVVTIIPIVLSCTNKWQIRSRTSSIRPLQRRDPESPASEE